MITTTDLTKVHRARGREVTALNGVDLHVRPGEILGVIGPSGAGKSSLVRCVNLLERPTSGTVTVDGVDLTALAGRGPRAGRELRAARTRIGMVFQHFNLLSSRTVRGNVELPLELLPGLTRRERARRAMELLDTVGLADRAGDRPARLSGGQKQRVGIARALAGRPKVLLSDEATSALDPETTRSVLGLIRDLNRSLGLTVLLITHEMEVVREVCDSVALMENGRITESGVLTDLLSRPGSRPARELFPPADPEPVAPGDLLLDLELHGTDPNASPGATGPDPLPEILHALPGAEIRSAAVDTVSGRRVGRMRLLVPGGGKRGGGGPDLDALTDRLRGRGVELRVVGGGPGGTRHGAVVSRPSRRTADTHGFDRTVLAAGEAGR
ncbi:methionine ABC transporter ATP-binding protein [Streptomyces sp. ST2-7A]|uniref:methionine ABC transporter ATP-binding protein n=1 Tax=Streptomyces sp. ST2-7A TaxID=2907214 RepID=UPI001F24C912|nr:ATP-binding cassette domain-containing protein [Streptomyces sp. ST2-7A]MCE7079751.1 ATP-binding cassette domain-containing protein [Streptomyces sp. ST2-7A]